MRNFLPCKPATPVACPDLFGLGVSGWIDRTNIGDSRVPNVDPPGGLRLRWELPVPWNSSRRADGLPDAVQDLANARCSEQSATHSAARHGTPSPNARTNTPVA
jgi:hypothetical protein